MCNEIEYEMLDEYFTKLKQKEKRLEKEDQESVEIVIH